jgi:two-component system NtrC family sensor kinase
VKNNYDVKKLIKYIKILPIAVALIFSIITTYLVVHNNIKKHEENIKNTKSDFIAKQKVLIKEEVSRIVRQIKYQKNTAETHLKKDIKTRVMTVYKIIENIYKENKHKTEKEIRKIVQDAIRTIRFNEGRGYFFINTMEGISVLFPPSSKLEGQNMWDVQDSKGNYNIRNFSKLAKEKGEGFVTWNWFKPTKDNSLETVMHKKIGYIKYIKELNWFVGSGEYLDSFENKIKKNLINEIQQIRYGKNGYIFVNQYDGLALAHINKKNIGKYRLNIKNQNGTYPLQEIMKVAKSGEGYVEDFCCINPTTNENDKKLSYVYGFNDWQWQIGASTYLSGIKDLLIQKEMQFKEKLYSSIISILITSVLLTLLLIFIMLKLLTIIEKEFAKYEKSLSNHIRESHKKDRLLAEQSKLASMGEMIGNISHQWRQPLSVISTASTGMKIQKEYGCLTDEIFNNSCDAINNNAQYLSNTIEDFKNFIKGDHVKKVFNLSTSINSFLHLVESSTKTNEITVELELNDYIEINGYENELIQCFMNIYSNSKDALLENKIKNKKLTIITSRKNNQAIIEIRDNAGGIPSKIINKIFEPYFTTKHQSQGTGLGLHMTYNLVVDGMNGTITVKNDKKFSGALFIITLPLQ